MHRQRSLVPVIVALIAAVVIARQVPAPASPSQSDGPIAVGPGLVLDVLDGDTARIRMAGYEGSVRIVGIDTPEIEHPGKPAGCFGVEAATAARAWLSGRVVEVVPAREQRDHFGRLLARVVPRDGPIAGRDLARVLALSGFARELPIAPNLDDAGPIADRVAIARRLGRGLWGACGFVAAFPGK
ncbi:MAG: thermonuclease family protein [Thermoleophilia bacterium]|nr:thermonuclease family protein [Thermoleophilia bacterium]